MSTLSAPPLPNASPGGTSFGLYNSLKLVIAHKIVQVPCKKLEKSQAQGPLTINMLADDVLLEIFSHCRFRSLGRNSNTLEEDLEEDPSFPPWNWLFLVHVCRRWRQITFASPRRLDLQILCTYGNPYGNWKSLSPSDEDDVIAALKHPDRVSQVSLYKTESQLGKIAAVMHDPFPLLESLRISSNGGDTLTIPFGFLGESAPSSQKIELFGVSYPTLPTLLLSTSNLVELNLSNVPPTGYISPDVMVAHLTPLPKLKTLHLGLPPTPSTQILPPPIVRNVLPSLHDLLFLGDCQYLEDLVARIDTPQLKFVVIDYWDQDIIFQVPRLSEFLNRSESLKQNLSAHCRIMLGFEVYFAIAGVTDDGAIRWDPEPAISIAVRSGGVALQIFHLTHVLNWIYPTLSNLVHLSIEFDSLPPASEELDDVGWLQLFWPFSSVQTLFVSDKFAGHVYRALAELVVFMITSILPALHVLCLEGQQVSSVDRLISFRQESGCPIFVNTETEFRERQVSYL